MVESRTQGQMAGRQPQAVNPSQSKIPIFVSHDLPIKVANVPVIEQFFKEANDACTRHYFDDPQGFLIQSKNNLNPTEGTIPPLSDKEPIIFEGWQINRVLEWARENLDGTTLTPNNVVILDQRTGEDGTCIMCSRANMPEVHGEFIIVRSDFESTLVTLRGKELGVMGDDALRTNYERFDGVLRSSARDQAESNAKR